MLQLKNITKDYVTGDQVVHALKGIDISFRDNEFVSILGQSGCGKTTLLNIIGGLDRYTEGDLLIDAISTKDYNDRLWDTYRNHKIGFVFQSYNLISHQSVLGNVELALTLSGVSKEERRKRALDALKKVGLEEQINKKPNQLSGGQMQRVAIARAIVNNPSIILADEPTGALDTETSIQVMDILKEISKDRLVIMVTHNPLLADKYSTRIVNLVDGLVTSDSNEYLPTQKELEELTKDLDLSKKKKEKKSSMNVTTAFSLSIRNLLTKKGRTILTSFAGSIGIIGIALILSLSSGFQKYINTVQEQTLSSYPLTIQKSSVDYSSFISSVMGKTDDEKEVLDGQIGVTNSLSETVKNISTSVYKNDLKSFKAYLESDDENAKEILDSASSIKYNYSMDLYTYYKDSDGNITKVNPNSLYSTLASSVMGTEVSSSLLSSIGMSYDIFGEMLPNPDNSGLYNADLILDQYELVGTSFGSRWPSKINEAVFVVDENNYISDYSYYALGFGSVLDALRGSGVTKPLNIEDILNLSYKVILPTSTYVKSGKVTINEQEYDLYKNDLNNTTLSTYYESSTQELDIVGIVRPKKGVASACLNSTIAYSTKFTEDCIEKNKLGEVYLAQKDNTTFSVISGKPIASESLSLEEQVALYYSSLSEEEKNQDTINFKQYLMSSFKESFTQVISQMIASGGTINQIKFGSSVFGGTIKYTLTPEEFSASFDVDYDTYKENYIDDEEIKYILFDITMPNIGDTTLPIEKESLFENSYNNAYKSYYEEVLKEYQTTYNQVMKELDIIDLDNPSSISIYSKSFQDKDKIINNIAKYNKANEENKITYEDYVGIMMSSISTILDAVTYVLIGFVSISLVVSSIMIGIITYISVLERTKEIGVLRSIGASKRDISLVFNAETITIGLLSGLLGIGVTVILNIPINVILKSLAKIGGISFLPWAGGVILVAISVFLTFISGLIPARMASKKDPVIALRSGE